MHAREVAAMIMSKLQASGHMALLAGGCVRDELLGREPDDYDIATDATPERITSLFARTAEVGAVFGVVLVRHGGVTVEVATFRADGNYSDARRPDAIRFSNPKDDSLRRDYTVNALFRCPREPEEDAFRDALRVPAPGGGWIIDFVGGLSDLRAKVLRAVGSPDQRLAEDHLRALRAARLAAKLGFEIESATADAIRTHASSLKGVSRERIGNELRMMLTDPTRLRAVKFVTELGLLKPILDVGEVSECRTLASLPSESTFALALSAWMIDLGISTSDDLRRVRDRLLLSNDERDDVKAFLAGTPGVAANWVTWGVAKKKRVASERHFAGVMALLRNSNAALEAEIHREVAFLKATESGLAPIPLLTGDSLANLGLRPGPMFKVILDAVYDAQLEDRVRTFEEALRMGEALAQSDRCL